MLGGSDGLGGWINALFERWSGKRPFRILVIDDWIPDPSIGAGAPRAIQVLRALSRTGASVVLFPTLQRADRRWTSIKQMLPNISFVTRRSGRLDLLGPFLKRRHASFDAIFVSRPHNLAAFNAAQTAMPDIAREKIVIYDSEAIFAEREILKRKTEGLQPLENDSVRDELELARGIQIVLAVNAHTKEMFRASGFGDVRILRHAIAPTPVRPQQAERTDLLFVGPTYANDTPNSDSVIWFVDHVLQSFRSQLGRDIPLTLVGRSMAPAVASRMDGRIAWRGPLQNLDSTYNKARVFIAPTRFASGVPLKIYEAAANGVPCVVTPILARQLGWVHDRELLVAETAEEFASQCLRLFSDETLWQRIRDTAHARAMDDCNIDHFNETVADLCRDLARFTGRILPKEPDMLSIHQRG